MSTFVNTLIIGQGLAGSLLATRLESHGERVFIIDPHHEKAASVVAAGLVNPITGHRFNLTENYAEFAQASQKLLDKVADQFSTSIWQNIDQFRVIKNQGQRDYFEQRLADPEYQDYLSEKAPPVAHITNHPFGIALIESGFVVDVSKLLYLVREWFSERNLLLSKRVDYGSLKFEDFGVSYGSIHAQRVVFCEGYQASFNPWLKSLPFKLAKGEVFWVSDVHSQRFDEWLSWGHWLVPSINNNKVARLGSSYQWGSATELQNQAEQTQKDKFLKSAQQYTDFELQIEHKACGIRPSTINRKPFIGAIPDLPNAYCFNGFGSKGCLTIPYYAQQLCEHFRSNAALEHQLPL